MGVTIHMLMISFFCCFCYINKTKEPKPQNFLEKFWFEAQTCFLLGRVFSVFPKAKTLLIFAFLKTSSLGVMQGAKNPSIFLRSIFVTTHIVEPNRKKTLAFFPWAQERTSSENNVWPNGFGWFLMIQPPHKNFKNSPGQPKKHLWALNP